MGTRSLTIVTDNYEYVDNNGNTIKKSEEYFVMYRQYDGYPEGHGLELFEFLNGMKIVNGFNSKTPTKSANGIGCLSAQLIAHFKDGVGNIYLYPAGTRDCGEDYIYEIYTKPKERNLYMRISKPYWKSYKGNEYPERVLYNGLVELFSLDKINELTKDE